ncbi:hypothetical protein [Fuerstiella marisgermanici]|uniref:Uncharacterized protein n=1 Tax=Fuerstiella marisgermanici TaxID=1891926 RepID=A0A1P8WRY8_9PLAN|nr:hypothetical protein [Fuerstiella marisgermanici]APZ96826.1 hypothetical protein Fuma_06500 [Fuerstiella marisgermanici]
MNPFKTRPQAIAFMCVSASVVLACLASIVVADVFMPDNLAGQKGVATFYRCFTPMIVVWSVLGVWAYLSMPERASQKSPATSAGV